jgi:methionine-rich copper-binding protein CopC
MRFISALSIVVCTLLLAEPGKVLAHANLISCSIKNSQTFSVHKAPGTITGTFTEELTPKKSWMSVFEGDADHGLVNETTTAVVNFNKPKTMTLRIKRKWRKGPFYLIWYTVSAVDGHKAAGIVYFKVK